MSTLNLKESTGTLKLFPSTSTLKYFQLLVLWKMQFRCTFKYVRDFGLYRHLLVLKYKKALRLGNEGKVLRLVFELLRTIRHVTNY